MCLESILKLPSGSTGMAKNLKWCACVCNDVVEAHRGRICMVVVHIGKQLSCLCDTCCVKNPKAHAAEVSVSWRTAQ